MPTTTSAAAVRVRGTRGQSRRWPWFVALVALGVFFLANVLYPSDDADVVWTVMFSSIIVAFVFVGALLTARVRGNPIGPLMLAAGALLATTIAIGTLAVVGDSGATRPWNGSRSPPSSTTSASWCRSCSSSSASRCIFPDGRLLSASVAVGHRAGECRPSSARRSRRFSPLAPSVRPSWPTRSPCRRSPPRRRAQHLCLVVVDSRPTSRRCSRWRSGTGAVAGLSATSSSG